MKNWLEINTQLKELVRQINKRDILIQSGHFSLVASSDGNLIPAIYSEIDDLKLKDFILGSEYMGDFPTKTMDSALYLIENSDQNKFNFTFTFIVNDWQWMNKGVYSPKQDRKDFFRKHTLPITFKNSLENTVSKNLRFFRKVQYGIETILLSETRLRKSKIKLTDFCSPSSCALEYFPFLKETMFENDVLISFIPESCKIPVLFASLIFIRDMMEEKELIHVFYNPKSKSKEIVRLNQKTLSKSTIKKIETDFEKMELMSR